MVGGGGACGRGAGISVLCSWAGSGSLVPNFISVAQGWGGNGLFGDALNANRGSVGRSSFVVEGWMGGWDPNSKRVYLGSVE